MQTQNLILTTTLFLGYMLLWGIKRKELIKKEGVDPNVIYKSANPIQKYFGVLEKLMTFSIVLIILLHYFFKNNLVLTSYFSLADISTLRISGFVLGLTGLTICRIAQITLGKSWRVGIDENAKPGLITRGIYKYVRNPTYTGMYLLCAGVILINPTILYSYWILMFFIMMEFQVRCEEEYLEKQYRQEYLAYCKKTKRYIPFIY